MHQKLLAESEKWAKQGLKKKKSNKMQRYIKKNVKDEMIKNSVKRDKKETKIRWKNVDKTEKTIFKAKLKQKTHGMSQTMEMTREIG